MKKFKISLLAVLAIALGIGLSSFTTSHKPTSQKWFSLTGSERTIASSYTPSGGTGADPQCPATPAAVCAIYANDDGNGNPVQSELNSIRTLSSDFTDVEEDLEYHE